MRLIRNNVSAETYSKIIKIVDKFLITSFIFIVLLGIGTMAYWKDYNKRDISKLEPKWQERYLEMQKLNPQIGKVERNLMLKIERDLPYRGYMYAFYKSIGW